MTETDFISLREFKDHHEGLKNRVDRLELRLEKLENDLDIKDVERREAYT